jgi:hypothetical protein
MNVDPNGAFVCLPTVFSASIALRTALPHLAPATVAASCDHQFEWLYIKHAFLPVICRFCPLSAELTIAGIWQKVAAPKSNGRMN